MTACSCLVFNSDPETNGFVLFHAANTKLQPQHGSVNAVLYATWHICRIVLVCCASGSHQRASIRHPMHTKNVPAVTLP
jgi:hypothetical protein